MVSLRRFCGLFEGGVSLNEVAGKLKVERTEHTSEKQKCKDKKKELAGLN